MAYPGLYVERCPNIKAAGRVKPHEDVGSCFVNISLEDKMAALGLSAPSGSLPPPPTSTPDFSDSQRYLGLYPRVAAILRPPVRGGAQVVRDELMDTVYQSYWRRPLGRVSDPTPGLPSSHLRGGITYGKKLPPQPPASEVVNPSKPPLQVSLEADVGHEFYKVTHDSYAPGERVGRRYEAPGYDPGRRRGIKSGVNWSGIYVRNCLNWCRTAPKTPVSRLQEAHARLRGVELGRAKEPNDYLRTCVAPGHAFGRSTVSDHGVLEAMRGDVAPPPERRLQLEEVGHANKIRRVLERRRPGFSFDDLLLGLRALAGAAGDVPLEAALAECRRHHVRLDAALTERLLRDLGVVTEGGGVRPQDLLAVLHHAKSLPPPGLPKIHDCARPDPGRRGEPGGPHTAHPLMPVAGLPSDHRPDHFSLDATSHAWAVLSPSVWTQYGLDHLDVFALRPKEEILRVLGAAGVVCPPQVLDPLVTTDGGLASLEDVRSALTRRAAARYNSSGTGDP